MRTLLLVAAALTLALPAAAAVRRYPGDERQVEQMRSSYPEVLNDLEKGEALASSGSLDEALVLLEKAEKEAPFFTLLRRRHCEVLTALGRRSEAVEACLHAMVDSRSNIDERALVRALVEGPAAPTSENLGEALRITSMERKRSPGMPAPAAMACAIAEGIGDGAMLRHCTEELERLAPNDPELPAALRALATQCPPWRFWAGWLAIAAAAGITLVHALLGGARRARTLGAVAAAALVLATPGVARAEGLPGVKASSSGTLSQWPVDDDHPENAIPGEADRNADPLEFGYWIQDVAMKAERADKHGDHAAALRFYGALAKAVPDRAVSFSRMCNEYEALGDIDSAINSCGDALMLDGVRLGDYEHFVRLVLAKPGKLGDKEVAALGQVVQHMKDDPHGQSAVDEIECQIGVRTSNVAQLRECTAALAAKAPDAPKTVTYQWALAIQEGKFAEADRLVARAGTLGVPVEAMKQTTAAGEKRRRLIVLGILLLSTLVAGAAAFLTRNVWRRRLISNPA
jgi:tetratricopeptide (TPR) repeat protein